MSVKVVQVYIALLVATWPTTDMLASINTSPKRVIVSFNGLTTQIMLVGGPSHLQIDKVEWPPKGVGGAYTRCSNHALNSSRGMGLA